MEDEEAKNLREESERKREELAERSTSGLTDEVHKCLG